MKWPEHILDKIFTSAIWKDNTLFIHFFELLICCSLFFFFFFFSFIFISWRLITLQYCSGSCHTLTWISHRFTSVPHPNPPSHLPPLPFPLGLPSAPKCFPEHLSHACNLGWWSVSPLIVYLFQCYSLRTSHPRLLPQSPKVFSIHLCLVCYFAYRVIVTIF